MTAVFQGAGFLLLTVVLLTAGWGLLGRAPLHLAFQAGAALNLVLLTALDLVGVPWSRGSLALVLLPFVALGLYRGGWQGLRWKRPGWGEVTAGAAVAVFAFVAWSLWSTNPDFIYHWGLKGQRYALAQGIDTDYLARPWNHYAHPAYPHLLPVLFAATAIVQGAWSEPWLLLWSPPALLLALAPCRAALKAIHEQAPASLQGQLAVALVGTVTAMFGVAHALAGGPDLFLTLALLSAAPALLRAAPRPGDARAVAVAAAFAAGSKTEGMVLAAGLFLAFLLHTWRTTGPPWRRRLPLLAMVLPTVVVVLPWLVQGRRFGLLTEPNSGPFNPANAPLVLPALGRSLLHPHWHGFAVVAVAAIPLLLAVRRTRTPAAVATGLLLFYVAAYFSARVGADFWVLSSFPRILVHLVPLLLLLLASVGLRQQPPQDEVPIQEHGRMG